jgi:hypothetical protein
LDQSDLHQGLYEAVGYVTSMVNRLEEVEDSSGKMRKSQESNLRSVAVLAWLVEASDHPLLLDVCWRYQIVHKVVGLALVEEESTDEVLVEGVCASRSRLAKHDRVDCSAGFPKGEHLDRGLGEYNALESGKVGHVHAIRMMVLVIGTM